MLLEGREGGYARLGQEWYVGADQGNNVPFNGKLDNWPMTLQQCEDACDQTDGCNSFAHCPRHQNRCWLTDKVYNGNEPTKHNDYCSTYYKTGIRSLLPNNIFMFN